MTKSTKVFIGTIGALVLTLLVLSFLMAAIMSLFGIPALIGGIFTFIVTFALLQGPWYTSYLDWIEDQLEKVIK